VEFWIWIAKIHFGSLGFEKTKAQISLNIPLAFTRSYRSIDTWLFLINESDSLRAIKTLATSGLWPLLHFAMFNSHNSPKHRTPNRWIYLDASLTFDGSYYFWNSGFGSLGIPHTSHFKTPEAYFPEHLDQLPPVPLKINDSCSLRAFCSGAILRTILRFLNARERLI
jgi:hypothetical protein